MFKKVLTIKIQSSLTKLFSFKILTVFFLFFAKQLSISSFILWFSVKLTNFSILFEVICFPLLAKFSIFNNSLNRFSLLSFDLFIRTLISDEDIEIFFSFKKLDANPNSAWCVSG